MMKKGIKEILFSDINDIFVISDDFLDAFASMILIFYILFPLFAGYFGIRYKTYDLMRERYDELYTTILKPIIYILFLSYIFLFSTSKKREKMKIGSSYVIFIFLIFWMILSTAINGITTYTIQGDSYRKESLLDQICYFVFFFFVSSKIKNDAAKKRIIFIQIIIGLLVAFIGFYLYATFPGSSFYKWKPSLTSVFYNTNHYAYYLTICIMLSSGLYVSEKNTFARLLSLFSITVNTIALSFNNTFGGWLACLVALFFEMIVFLIIKNSFQKQTIIPFLVFMITTFITGIWTKNVFSSIWKFIFDIGSILNHSENSGKAGSSRWKIWQAGISLIAKRPLFGYGVEGTLANNLESVMFNGRIHNEYLQYALWYGIPAGIAYFIGVLMIYIDGLKKKYFISAITIVSLIGAFGYLVSAFFGVTAFYTAPYLFIYLGLAYGGIIE